MLMLLPSCPQIWMLLSIEAMEALLCWKGGSTEPGLSSSTRFPQTSSFSGPKQYLLIDAQGVPYTVLAGRGIREDRADGTSVHKKVLVTAV